LVLSVPAVFLAGMMIPAVFGMPLEPVLEGGRIELGESNED